MPNQKDRIIIDTNLWISFLLTKDFSKFDRIISNQEIELIFSQELVDEIVEVTQRIKFRKYFDLEDVETLLEKLKDRGILIKVYSKIKECKDPKDNFLLSLAVDGYASHLISGDSDLLLMKKIGATKILSMTEYLSKK